MLLCVNGFFVRYSAGFKFGNRVFIAVIFEPD